MSRGIKDITIVSFRGIKNLEIMDLGDINIITGDNNSGKTSVLEVLQTLDEPYDLRTWVYLRRIGRNPFMELSLYDQFDMLFNVDDQEKYIEYFIRTTDNHEKQLKIEVNNETISLTKKEMQKIDTISDVYLENNTEDDNEKGNEEDVSTIDVSRYNIVFKENNIIVKKNELYDFQRRINRNQPTQINRNKVIYISPVQHAEGRFYLGSVFNEPQLYEEMIEILREFDDDIISINADKSNNNYSRMPVYKILTRSHKTAIPLNFYGDGMKKAILLMSAVVVAKDGILLIDEFETAIHTSAMDKIFSWILKTCIKLNIQVFMTSHSKEAIEKVLRCSPELQMDIRLITLYKNIDKTVARVFNGEKALELSEQMGLELR